MKTVIACRHCGLPHGSHLELCESDVPAKQLQDELAAGTLLTEQELELGFGQKLDICYRLSLEVLFEDDRCLRQRSWVEGLAKDLSDDLWAWGDGLMTKYHMKQQTGRCSLQAKLDYDLGAEEQKLDETIVRFSKVLQDHGLKVPAYIQELLDGNADQNDSEQLVDQDVRAAVR